MIDCCAEVLRAEADERRYRAYVTDALMILTENTARYWGGRRLAGRWTDGSRRGDARSGDEIA
ncbi:MAG: hypothetical protein IJ646_00880, partial [Clostridia bacterium]|nr:hypothetical protein [Clostridia bacterium]